MEIEYTLECLPEKTPVRGNALASGDDAEDRAAEDEILARLERGDDWAWCMVKVTARVETDAYTFEGVAYLGCCSYANEADFKVAGGYYDDMKIEARADLKGTILEAIDKGKEAKNVLLKCF